MFDAQYIKQAGWLATVGTTATKVIKSELPLLWRQVSAPLSVGRAGDCYQQSPGFSMRSVGTNYSTFGLKMMLQAAYA